MLDHMYQHSLAVHIPAKSTTIILLDCKEHNGRKQLTKEAFALKNVLCMNQMYMYNGYPYFCLLYRRNLKIYTSSYE